MKNKTTVYNCVREMRKNRGWTQTELASICNTTKNTISAIELGFFNPGIGLSILLAYAFDVAIEELFVVDVCNLENVKYRKANIEYENQSNRN